MKIISFALISLFNFVAFTHVKAQSKPSGRLLQLHTSPGNKPQNITTKAQWSQKRAQILDSMQSVMGKLPPRTGNPPMNIQFHDTLRENTYTRYKISFTPAQAEIVYAFLYIPNKRSGYRKYPAMLALHPTGMPGKLITDGQGDNPNLTQRKNRAYGKELAERGFVVIAPDYPSFGEAKDYNFAKDRYESATMKAIFDNMRCVDLLQAMPQVDPLRIGVIGHSLGGHNAIFTAAFDTRLKIVVSSCGWTMLDYYNIGEEASKRYGGRLGPFAQDRYMPLFREKYRLEGDKIPFDFDELIAALAPRTFFSCSPLKDSNFDVKGVNVGIDNASVAYKFLGVENKLQVRYPDSGHDFPYETRQEAYQLIDKVLGGPSN